MEAIIEGVYIGRSPSASESEWETHGLLQGIDAYRLTARAGTVSWPDPGVLVRIAGRVSAKQAFAGREDPRLSVMVAEVTRVPGSKSRAATGTE